jgi:hypothetical protein
MEFPLCRCDEILYASPNIIKLWKALKILIETFRNDRQRPDITSWPFFLIILYPEQGFYLEYAMERISTGAEFLGCPSKSFFSIVTWSPSNSKAYSKIIEYPNGGGNLTSYKEISEATSLSADEFYQMFKSPKNTRCIRTPIDTWPNP